MQNNQRNTWRKKLQQPLNLFHQDTQQQGDINYNTTEFFNAPIQQSSSPFEHFKTFQKKFREEQFGPFELKTNATIDQQQEKTQKTKKFQQNRIQQLQSNQPLAIQQNNQNQFQKPKDYFLKWENESFQEDKYIKQKEQKQNVQLQQQQQESEQSFYDINISQQSLSQEEESEFEESQQQSYTQNILKSPQYETPQSVSQNLSENTNNRLEQKMKDIAEKLKMKKQNKRNIQNSNRTTSIQQELSISADDIVQQAQTRVQNLTAQQQEQYKSVDLIQNGSLKAFLKKLFQKLKDNALCLQMCPQEEIYDRNQFKQRHRLEYIWSISRPDYQMIKKFQRSSADRNLNIPEQLRTPIVLLETTKYLIHVILKTKHVSEFDKMEFIQDWFRCIWQDFNILFSFDENFRGLKETILSYELMLKQTLLFVNRLRNKTQIDEKLLEKNITELIKNLILNYKQAKNIKQAAEKNNWFENEEDLCSYFCFDFPFEQQVLLFDLFTTFQTSESQFQSLVNQYIILDVSLTEEQNFYYLTEFTKLVKSKDILSIMRLILKMEPFLFNLCCIKYTLIPLFIQLYEQLEQQIDIQSFVQEFLVEIFEEGHQEFWEEIQKVYELIIDQEISIKSIWGFKIQSLVSNIVFPQLKSEINEWQTDTIIDYIDEPYEWGQKQSIKSDTEKKLLDQIKSVELSQLQEEFQLSDKDNNLNKTQENSNDIQRQQSQEQGQQENSIISEIESQKSLDMSHKLFKLIDNTEYLFQLHYIKIMLQAMRLFQQFSLYRSKQEAINAEIIKQVRFRRIENLFFQTLCSLKQISQQQTVIQYYKPCINLNQYKQKAPQFIQYNNDEQAYIFKLDQNSQEQHQFENIYDYFFSLVNQFQCFNCDSQSKDQQLNILVVFKIEYTSLDLLIVFLRNLFKIQSNNFQLKTEYNFQQQDTQIILQLLNIDQLQKEMKKLNVYDFLFLIDLRQEFNKDYLDQIEAILNENNLFELQQIERKNPDLISNILQRIKLQKQFQVLITDDFFILKSQKEELLNINMSNQSSSFEKVLLKKIIQQIQTNQKEIQSISLKILNQTSLNLNDLLLYSSSFMLKQLYSYIDLILFNFKMLLNESQIQLYNFLESKRKKMLFKLLYIKSIINFMYDKLSALKSQKITLASFFGIENIQYQQLVNITNKFIIITDLFVIQINSLDDDQGYDKISIRVQKLQQIKDKYQIQLLNIQRINIEKNPLVFVDTLSYLQKNNQLNSIFNSVQEQLDNITKTSVSQTQNFKIKPSISVDNIFVNNQQIIKENKSSLIQEQSETLLKRIKAI